MKYLPALAIGACFLFTCQTIYADAISCVGAFRTSSNEDTAFDQRPISQVISYSGNFNLTVTLRNIPSFNTLIRSEAYIAYTQGRPLHIAEISRGLPLTAMPFIDENSVRPSGDMLVFLTAPSANPFEDTYRPGSGRYVRLQEPQKTQVTIITPADATLEYLRGVPAQYDSRGYFAQQLFSPLQSRIKGREKNSWGRWTSPQLANAEVAAYQRAQAEGKLNVLEGNILQSLRSNIREGKRFDILVNYDFASYQKRAEILEAIQNSLHPDGRAIIPTKWWSFTAADFENPTSFQHVEDSVQSKNGKTQPLIKYLTKNYPEYFEEYDGSDVQLLIVKGSKKPLSLPSFKLTQIAGKVREGMPLMLWIEQP